MGKPSLKLYIDVVSPFAYIAFHVVRVSQQYRLTTDIGQGMESASIWR